MKQDKRYADIRLNYAKDSLLEKNIAQDPFEQFSSWFDDAYNSDVHEANAMVLSTCVNNKPSGRVVLLKDVTDQGFIFYTNYNSRKGREIAENPNVALTFHWDKLERQVRIEGSIEKTSAETSDKYFYSRPPKSQVGAMVSPQSETVADRDVLDSAFDKALESGNIKRPGYWGGYLVIPHHIEFWQGRPNRMHDRIVYEREAEGKWKRYRLAP